MDKRILIHVQGGRKVTGVLRGFDIFLNLVVDDASDESTAGDKKAIGMVVSLLAFLALACTRRWTETASWVGREETRPGEGEGKEGAARTRRAQQPVSERPHPLRPTRAEAEGHEDAGVACMSWMVSLEDQGELRSEGQRISAQPRLALPWSLACTPAPAFFELRRALNTTLDFRHCP